MKRLILTLLLGFVLGFSGRAQAPDSTALATLGAKLDEYFAVLTGSPAEVQNAECDFLISSCQDSLVRQWVTLHIYDHYLHSPVMGDDAVAVHVAKEWLLSGKVPMHSSLDRLNAEVFVMFNESTLIGKEAPQLSMTDPEGKAVTVPGKGEWTVLYFFDTSCSTCRVETARLEPFLQQTPHPVRLCAVFTGVDPKAWEAYRKEHLRVEGALHAWDPEMASDYQMLYGVLQTPRMFLLDPEGVVVGRGLDTPALSILLDKVFGTERYTYGEERQMALLEELFAPYGADIQPDDILQTADYLAARTFGEGDVEAFKQVEGDLLYYLSSKRGEAWRDGTLAFIERFIELPDVWNSPDDSLQVLPLAAMLKDLIGRTPVGSQVPDLTVPGVLRRKPCLFRKDRKEGEWALRKLKGEPLYLVFYAPGCSCCEETLAAVDALVASERKAQVLLVNMDTLYASYPDLAQTLLDSFDLSALPLVLELGKEGLVRHRYVNLQ